MLFPYLCSTWAILACLIAACRASGSIEHQVTSLFGGQNATAGSGATHTNNWAVLVCSSRYWFNYRHMANTLAMYRTLKRLGMPDSNIILMLADDVACSARNPFPATVYANSGRQMDLYGDAVEVDYRGYEVTVESFLRLLTGRHPLHTPPSKRLLTDASSNVFIYMTGHGGNEFLKFQDNEEVSAFDIADAIEQMSEKRRFNKLLFVIDTCQANTMYTKFYSPNVIATGSSALGESSYSHHNDIDLGTAVIDSYTHYILQYLETLGKTSKASLQDFFNTYDPARIHSHPGISTSLSLTQPDDILVTDFFGAVADVEVTPRAAELDLLRGGRGAGALSWEVGKRQQVDGEAHRSLWGSRLGLPPAPSTPAAGEAETTQSWKSPLLVSQSQTVSVQSASVSAAAAMLIAYLVLGRSGSDDKARQRKTE